MKLNKEQITRIKDFISHRGFTYYDVQLEIIDHVACKVEELMTADPHLSLDLAIQQTHAQFGPLGFSVVEDSMQSALQTRYWKLFRTTFISYLKPVYLPLIAGFIYLVYVLSRFINAPVTMINLTWILIFALALAYAIINYRSQQQYKRMLTAQMNGIVAIVVNVPIQLYNMVHIFTKGITQPGITGIILGFFLTFITISFFALQQMQKIAAANCRELEEQYQLTVGI